MRRHYLSKREQQIMDILHERGSITAVELEQALGGGLSNATVRSHLRTLEAKGHVAHREEGARFVYVPTQERAQEGRSALQAVMQTFFDGSVTNVVATLLNDRKDQLTEDEMAQLRKLVEAAKEEGR